jgi:hypothetical protein
MRKLFWDAQIILGCVNYFGMRKLFWDAQIILGFVHLGCTNVQNPSNLFLVASIASGHFEK